MNIYKITLANGDSFKADSDVDYESFICEMMESIVVRMAENKFFATSAVVYIEKVDK